MIQTNSKTRFYGHRSCCAAAAAGIPLLLRVQTPTSAVPIHPNACIDAMHCVTSKAFNVTDTKSVKTYSVCVCHTHFLLVISCCSNFTHYLYFLWGTSLSLLHLSTIFHPFPKGWRTMLVIPELEQEVKLLSESKSTRKV